MANVVLVPRIGLSPGFLKPYAKGLAEKLGRLDAVNRIKLYQDPSGGLILQLGVDLCIAHLAYLGDNRGFQSVSYVG